MKRLALMGLGLLLALLISGTVHAKPVVIAGKFCTEGIEDTDCALDRFNTKFFKEKFFGGGPGELGNVLMAKGQGFMLQNVVLDEEPISCAESPELCDLSTDHPCYVSDPDLAWDFVTSYRAGMLTLNSKGPWLNKGMLKSKSFDVTNYSRHDEDGNLLGFCLVIENGTFRNAPGYTFNASAKFDATTQEYQLKQDDDGKFVFQRGYDFDAAIEIIETP